MLTLVGTRKNSKCESRKRQLEIEKLDSRQLMAGNVLAGLNWEGQLQLSGDANSNYVRVTQIGSTTYRVTGLQHAGLPTTVNGQNYRDFANVRSVNANLGDGDDRIEVGSSGLKGFTTSLPLGIAISTGSGTDTVQIDAVSTIMDVNIDGGTGNDTIRVARSAIGHPQDEFRQGDLFISAGLGSDTVNVSNSSVIGQLYVDTGLGLATDQVFMTGLNIGRDVIVMADEPDAFRIDTKVNVEIRDTTAADDVIVQTTKAKANVKLVNVNADRVFARMGAANDTLYLDDISALYTDADGGAGFDVIYRHLAGAVTRRNFERDYLIW